MEIAAVIAVVLRAIEYFIAARITIHREF